jgi:uncharacterized lipoprotein
MEVKILNRRRSKGMRKIKEKETQKEENKKVKMKKKEKKKETPKKINCIIMCDCDHVR